MGNPNQRILSTTTNETTTPNHPLSTDLPIRPANPPPPAQIPFPPPPDPSPPQALPPTAYEQVATNLRQHAGQGYGTGRTYSWGPLEQEAEQRARNAERKEQDAHAPDEAGRACIEALVEYVRQHAGQGYGQGLRYDWRTREQQEEERKRIAQREKEEAEERKRIVQREKEEAEERKRAEKQKKKMLWAAIE
ncbi:hypothetical protein MMC26_005710 [Xylographa opegraphella]|nr:hypothetical protein [Xylographa opegraphella]